MGGWRKFFEPEETVGTAWHRATERFSPPPGYPEAAVRLERERGRLAVLFRGLGGSGGVELKPLAAQQSAHRLGFFRRIGTEAERLAVTSFDGAVLGLPETIDTFPDSALNADLYLWLAAFAAFLEPQPISMSDPLQADLRRLQITSAAVRTALAACPGLAPVYRRLTTAILQSRPDPKLPPLERELEAAIRIVLQTASRGAAEAMPEMARAIIDDTAPLGAFVAPLDYKPYRLVELWPSISAAAPNKRRPDGRDDEAGSGAADTAEKRVKAERRRGDQADRKDSLIIHRFEHILSWAEFLNINRTVDDEDEENARKALDDADRISVVRNRKKAATRLSFDLDLAPDDVDTEKLSGVSLYPEWDYRLGDYRPDFARVLASRGEEAPGGLKLDGPARRRINTVRRRFEALRPGRSIEPRQMDGEELDLEAAVRSAIDVRAAGEGSDRIWRRRRDTERDLAVSVLVDTSRSTEGACGARTVIEIAREALIALTEGIHACGDHVAVNSFSSLRRDRVFVRSVKGFDEPVDEHVRARIAALKPGFYTRIGAAVRHSAAELAQRSNRKKLLLVLTDGRPNDLDHYEGRYGIEDSRRAVLEARRQGLAVFGVTVDAKARSYFPYIFGANGFAIVGRPDDLAAALPVVWQHLVTG